MASSSAPTEQTRPTVPHVKMINFNATMASASKVTRGVMASETVGTVVMNKAARNYRVWIISSNAVMELASKIAGNVIMSQIVLMLLMNLVAPVVQLNFDVAMDPAFLIMNNVTKSMTVPMLQMNAIVHAEEVTSHVEMAHVLTGNYNAMVMVIVLMAQMKLVAGISVARQNLNVTVVNAFQNGYAATINPIASIVLMKRIVLGDLLLLTL